MRFNKLDLNLLVALDVMLREASISRAAERLHMSQSAMSHALGRLREHFGDDLLVQVGRQMELTPRAEMLRDTVHDLLLRIDSTLSAKPAFDPSESDREFRISLSDFTMATLMPHVLAKADSQSAKVRFSLMPQVDMPDRAIERGEVDLLVLPTSYCSRHHPLEELFVEHFLSVVWNGSPLAHGELTLERYSAARHIVMKPIGSQSPSFEAASVKQHGIERQHVVTGFSFALAPRLVVGTNLIATVQARLAHEAERTLPVVVRTPPVEVPPMVQAVQWHKYRTNDPGIAWLRGILHEAARAMDAEPAHRPIRVESA